MSGHGTVLLRGHTVMVDMVGGNMVTGSANRKEQSLKSCSRQRALGPGKKALEEYFLLLRPLFLAFGSQNFVSVLLTAHCASAAFC